MLFVATALAFHCGWRSRADRLRDAARSEPYRTVEGRLCGFEFRRLPPYGGEARQQTTAHVVAAARTVVAGAEDEHARGVAFLLLGRNADAVAHLQRAASSNGDARVWNDLAAALVAFGQAAADQHAFAEALAAADRALALQPRMPEALFNRAVALRALRLKEAAARAFLRYAAVDPSTGWTDEALASTSRLRARQRSWQEERPSLESAAGRGDWRTVEAIGGRHPEEARTWGEVEFLGEWGSRLLAHHDAAARHALDIARALGGALVARNSESLLHDGVEAIDRSSSPLALARAHETLRRARRAYAERKNAEAVRLFESAAEALRVAGSPMWLKAARYQAAALHDAGKPADGLKMIDELQRDLPRAYPALHAELLWQRGTIEATQGRVVEAIDSYKQASTEFTQLGEVANSATVKQMLAGRYESIGARTEAWAALVSAFDAMSVRTPDDLQRALSGAARGELAEEHWAVARSFLDVVRDLDLLHQNARREAFIWTERAIAGWRLGAPDFAADLSRARAAAARIPDESARAAATFDIRFVEASAAVETDPVRADAALTANIDWATRTQYLTRLPEQYLERCRARLRLRRAEEACADLVTALDIVRTRGRSVDSFGRAALSSAVDRAIDELAVFFVDAGKPQIAFGVIERAAANVVGRRAAPQRGGASAPPGVTYVRYRVVDDRVLIFALDSSAIRFAQVRRARGALRRDIEALSASIRAERKKTAVELLTRLHDVLIAPLRMHSGASSRLVFAPDAVLAAVPFAALRDRTSGRALVQDHAVAYAWSSDALTAGSAGGTSGGALVVANPAVSPRVKPSLAALPAAEAEGREVAAMWGTTCLTGRAATPRAVCALMPKASIFHFGGHAAENVVDGRYSFLALAGDDQTSGLLYLHEIEALDLHELRTAVLVACRTSTAAARQRYPLSLSASFLTAGAHSVVGTLWDIDDGAALQFSLRFHHGIKAGEEPVDAVRRAQLEMLAASGQGDAAFDWVPFQVWIG